jgi:hypothetical protein
MKMATRCGISLDHAHRQAMVVLLLCTLPTLSSGAALGQMTYQTPKPLIDFANLTGPGAEVIGTVSMIDGNQKAIFDSSGQIASGTGRFEYSAKTPVGLYMNFDFQVDGKLASGGIQISDLIVEYRTSGQGADARQYCFIDQFKAIGNQFNYAVIEKEGTMPTTGTTVVREMSVVDGTLWLLLADLRGSRANQWFSIKLAKPLSGILQEEGAPPHLAAP